MEKQRPVRGKTHFVTRIIWGLILLLGCLVIAIWITGYTYIYKTLIYTYPGIDDINIFDTRTVNDSAGIPWPLSSEYNRAKLPIATLAELEENQSTAYLVIRNDSIVHEEYWDHFSANTLSNSFSMAKSIVSILTGIAVNERYFSLDDSVGKFFPEYSKGMNSHLKVRHLLTMSSGLNWDESYNSLFSKTTEAYYGADLMHQVMRLKVIEEPGKTFRYMSCNTVLLALIIKKTTGMNISDYASQKLWKPIQAAQPAYWSLDQNEGLEKSYCCFYTSARDFARIGKLYLDSGMWNGRMIVPKDFVAASLTPNGLTDETGQIVDYYGYQWWLLNHNGHSVFYARGILGQYIIVVPDEKMIIVRLGKIRGEKNEKNQYVDMLSYMDGAIEAFGHQSN